MGCLDLNADGIEGFCGLEGSVSGPLDREIFVYDSVADRLIQLTDDEWQDRWPSVARDGSIVWMGAGGLPGSISHPNHFEIFLVRASALEAPPDPRK